MTKQHDRRNTRPVRTRGGKPVEEVGRPPGPPATGAYVPMTGPEAEDVEAVRIEYQFWTGRASSDLASFRRVVQVCRDRDIDPCRYVMSQFKMTAMDLRPYHLAPDDLGPALARYEAWDLHARDWAERCLAYDELVLPSRVGHVRVIYGNVPDEVAVRTVLRTEPSNGLSPLFSCLEAERRGLRDVYDRHLPHAMRQVLSAPEVYLRLHGDRIPAVIREFVYGPDSAAFPSP